MLLCVGKLLPTLAQRRLRLKLWVHALGLGLVLVGGAIAVSSQAPAQTPQSSETQQPAQSPQSPPTSQTNSVPTPVPSATPTPQFPPQRPGLNIVVIDPAHGGTDPGARGTGGIRESELVLDITQQVRRALELQGFQVVQTRQGNENPSFDDRSAIANAQTGAVFVTLHISSTGLPGTARVYISADLPQTAMGNGLISWDKAQAPFQGLSRKLGDIVQGMLAQRFKGSPSTAQTASVRQLRTTAAPAIAVEISSVSVDDRAELDRMIPGVADAIARGVAEFKPSYVVAVPGATP
jgi:N-acetylmuramoyl-L-alanine amidase